MVKEKTIAAIRYRMTTIIEQVMIRIPKYSGKINSSRTSDD